MSWYSMIRRLYIVTPEQDAYIGERAKILKISKSEWLRRLIDKQRKQSS
jgi:hypothetical protein